MATEQQAFIHRFMTLIWSKKNTSLVREVFASNAIIHSTAGESYGVEAMEKTLQHWYEGFPDLKLLLLGVFEQNDKVAVQWTAYGTHMGTFMGVRATMRPVKCGGTSIYRLHDGKVIEYWAYVNVHQLLRQLVGDKISL